MMKKMIVSQENMLFPYLKEKLPNYSKNNIKSFLSKRMVIVNGKVVTKYDYPLKKGDNIEIRETVMVDKEGRKLSILYEDEELIAVDKPCSLLTIATDKEKEKTLYHMVREYVKRRSSKNKVFIVHRLDKDTSGVVLFAKSEKIQKQLQQHWNLEVKRIYYAIVVGHPKDKERLQSYLKEDSRLFSHSSVTGHLAITEYEKVKENEKYSLLKIQILTGRKNQIRVQLAEHGYPILGDTKYGVVPCSRMMLHAGRINFLHPVTKEHLTVISSLPKIFQAYMSQGEEKGKKR